MLITLMCVIFLLCTPLSPLWADWGVQEAGSTHSWDSWLSEWRDIPHPMSCSAIRMDWGERSFGFQDFPFSETGRASTCMRWSVLAFASLVCFSFLHLWMCFCLSLNFLVITLLVLSPIPTMGLWWLSEQQLALA